MKRLAYEDLKHAPLDGLVRLAGSMGLNVRRPSTERGYRHELISAIMATEKRLARQPKGPGSPP